MGVADLGVVLLSSSLVRGVIDTGEGLGLSFGFLSGNVSVGSCLIVTEVSLSAPPGLVTSFCLFLSSNLFFQPGTSCHQ